MSKSCNCSKLGSKREWQVVRLAQILSLNTTMRGCEIKGLRWRDIDLIGSKLVVRRATTKSDAGERMIPLNVTAMSAILELYRRAQLVGSEPHHYVFPACENGKIDPARPQITWRTAWRQITRVVHCPACGELQKPGETCRKKECNTDIRSCHSPLAGLRFHDLRHHAITELSESQASDQTIMSIAGTSPRKCSHTILMFVWPRSVKRWMRSLAKRQWIVTSQSTTQTCFALRLLIRK
jgi:integrase